MQAVSILVERTINQTTEVLLFLLLPLKLDHSWQGPTLVFWEQVEPDKLRLSSWPVTLESGPSSNHLTGDSLSSQLVKSSYLRKCRTLTFGSFENVRS